MDTYLLLRFAHLLGLMLISAGLIGVFVADMHSRQASDVRLFTQAVAFIAKFCHGLVVPGALLLLGSGVWLIVAFYGGWEFVTVPWLLGMVILFAFEFIDGNTITRLYFMRLRRLSRAALAEGRITPELARARAEQIASFTHFLDIPILLVIVSLGVLRPSNWLQFRRCCDGHGGGFSAELLRPPPLSLGRSTSPLMRLLQTSVHRPDRDQCRPSCWGRCWRPVMQEARGDPCTGYSSFPIPGPGIPRRLHRRSPMP